jgi:Ni,Fe-hydrogenase III large subunit
MKIEKIAISAQDRPVRLKTSLDDGSCRLGLITSIDGSQLATVVFNLSERKAYLWESPVDGHAYSSVTPLIAQCHWYERTVWDMFGLEPIGHPRLKHNLLHEPYAADLLPLAFGTGAGQQAGHRAYRHLNVTGDGVYEIPVGPIHAGIIEPGHFRFSCLGEVILNLEIRLGYVHRGIEKRLTEVPWPKARFVAEAAATDTVAGNALAHAEAIESMLDVEVPERSQSLRAVSLELERVAMHIIDLGGLAGDIGFLAISSSMSRLRGDALRMAELLTGSRFQRSFICPGGIATDVADSTLAEIRKRASKLKDDLAPVVSYILTNQSVCERMQRVGTVSPALASDFGLVGVGARASNQLYDVRTHLPQGAYLRLPLPIATEKDGDVHARAKVRINEIEHSLNLIVQVLEKMSQGEIRARMPSALPANSLGLGVVEAHRGELVHLVFTDGSGAIQRYAIKDPSVNNWTGLAIAVRNNLVADFPLCNKSFSLSYSGHDL